MLLTRREIIEIWQGQNKELLDMFCCPNCRDILQGTDEQNVLKCLNAKCSYFEKNRY